MRTISSAAGATAIAVALLAWTLHSLDPRTGFFAFVVVWVPMVWLGTVSRVAQPRLPKRYHRLRSFERDGRLYELVGVRLAKRLLRRGPLAVFNPSLHLPAEPTPASLRHLDQRMRDAEASHVILLVLTLGISVNAAARGWWGAAGWTLLFNLAMNGYPVMLQRYNRALLSQRYNSVADQPLHPQRRSRGGPPDRAANSITSPSWIPTGRVSGYRLARHGTEPERRTTPAISLRSRCAI